MSECYFIENLLKILQNATQPFSLQRSTSENVNKRREKTQVKILIPAYTLMCRNACNGENLTASGNFNLMSKVAPCRLAILA